MNQDLPWLEEELTAHSQWVRRLARSLVHDETAAEDLVQDTWVAALSRPPADRRALRGWLGRVVRTLAWKRQRRVSTVPIAGDEGEVPEGAPESELVERLELHHLLAEELRAIREPLRTTLLQRYFEGLSAAQIAERTGVPAPTVRWRLQQGLAELRARLDARFGGERETWMSALAFAFPSKGTVLAGSGVAIGEGVLMSMLVKISLGVAALVAAVLLVLPMVVKKDVPSHVPALADNSVHPLEAASDAPLKPNESLVTESAGPERATVAEEARLAAATEGQTRVVARILDEKLRPIANAWLCPVDYTPQSSRIRRESAVRSVAGGAVALEWTGAFFEYPVRFGVGADGFAMQFPTGIVKSGETLQLGDLVLRPGGSVSGHVVDAKQHGIAGAEVAVDDWVQAADAGIPLAAVWVHSPGQEGGVPSARSSDDGSFLVENVSLGMTRVWARVGERPWSISPPIEIAAGSEVQDLVLVVDSGIRDDAELRDVDGVVLAPDGSPIDGAQLQVNQSGEGGAQFSSENAGSGGRFRLHPHARDVTFEVTASDPAGRYVQASIRDIKPGSDELVIRLKQPKTFVLAVRDAHGPLENFRVTWSAYELYPRPLFADEAETHANGRAVVRVLASPCYFRVAAPGHQTGKLGPIGSQRLPAELSIDLISIPGIHGRVLAGGKSVAGAKLSLYASPEPNNEVRLNGFTTRVNYSAEASATSDAEGRFMLDLQRDGTYSIFADAESYARCEHGPLPLQALTGLQDLELKLDTGGALEGHVLMPPGRSPAGVIVGINRGDARPFTRTVGPDGGFRFEHLTPGAWEIQREDQEFTATPMYSGSIGEGIVGSPLRHDFDIAVGQTTHKDLDLRDAGPCVVEIQLTNNSRIARGWSIVPHTRSKIVRVALGPPAMCDASGHARLESPDPGDCTLVVSPPPETGAMFPFEFDVTLRRGTNSWSQDIKTGAVEGTIGSWQPGENPEWRIRTENENIGHRLKPDAAGHYSLSLVPTGKLTILRAGETVQTFELAAGETKALQLP